MIKAELRLGFLGNQQVKQISCGRYFVGWGGCEFNNNNADSYQIIKLSKQHFAELHKTSLLWASISLRARFASV